MPYLPNGHELVLPGLGHTDDFWDYQPKASSHLVNTYLDRGQVDTSLYAAEHLELEPDFAQTTIAKILLAVLLGFAALTIVSLLLLALRVCRRGLGRKASGAVRGAYVIVLGLGGWFIGELIVLTALPTVALDSQLVSTLSIGLPVGLGVFLAWFQAGRPARANVIGLRARWRRARRRLARLQRLGWVVRGVTTISAPRRREPRSDRLRHDAGAGTGACSGVDGVPAGLGAEPPGEHLFRAALC